MFSIGDIVYLNSLDYTIKSYDLNMIHPSDEYLLKNKIFLEIISIRNRSIVNGNFEEVTVKFMNISNEKDETSFDSRDLIFRPKPLQNSKLEIKYKYKQRWK